MADEAIEAPDAGLDADVQDTPAPEGTPADAAPEAPSEPSIDWQKRYEDLRPQWDRTKQQVAEYEQYAPLIQSLQNDPAGTIRALQEQYGDALEDDDDEFEDPGERALRMLQEQQETAQQAAAREQRAAAEEQYVAEGIDALSKRDNVELSDHAQALLYALATNDSLRGENGAPDVETAYEALRSFEKEVKENYISSKKAPRIPSGRAGEKSVDLSNDADRINYFAELAQANLDS